MRELIIDLDAIEHNLQTMTQRVTRHDDSRPLVMCVVKADAYGHGMIPVARKLEAAGADYLGVADISEALALRNAGIDLPILAWLHSPRETFLAALSAGIELGIANIEQLERVAKAAESTGRVARIHFKIDTGLGRNGSSELDWAALLERAKELVAAGRIQTVGIFSHLSCTSEADDLRQIARFEAAIDKAREMDVAFELRHLTASDGSLNYPQALYDMVRIGVALYGLSPFVEHSSADFGLVPAMTATALVVQTKRVPAGQGVSYGYLHHTDVETTLALIPVGYAEGLPRDASGRAKVSIKGKTYDVSSRIAMDQFVIDVGDDAVAAGDEVVIFGDPAAGVPSADDWAVAGDTINYEIVTRMGGRFARRYLGAAE
ncbi:MAG: alanine racemase [Actinomycetales bacterium]|nr:alanine racemase [Actinomycetales bacterium]